MQCFQSIDKNVIKKFSAENNMDPGDVPEELQGLTEIEEMLVAQIFPIVSVYCIRGGQHAYCVSVNLSSRCIRVFNTTPSLLDILIMCCRSAFV